jgi:capsular polysaccharide transport system permease protein
VAQTRALRSPWVITLSVWHALFLRETVGRMSATRYAWMGVFFEPVIHIGLIMILFSTIRVRVIGGIETATWIMAGLLVFFLFRRPAQRCIDAISSSRPLFAFRQVRPIDILLVRAAIEGFLMIVISALLLPAAGLFGVPVFPHDPLMVLGACFGMWLCGLGWGMTASVISELLPELGKVIGFFMHPLYFFSGVMFPLHHVPQPYRDWLLLNPLAHGVEAARLGFAPFYHAFPETSLLYLHAWGIGLVFLGLALQTRYVLKLTTE